MKVKKRYIFTVNMSPVGLQRMSAEKSYDRALLSPLVVQQWQIQCFFKLLFATGGVAVGQVSTDTLLAVGLTSVQLGYVYWVEI
jgi:hypothetical protein